MPPLSLSLPLSLSIAHFTFIPHVLVTYVFWCQFSIFISVIKIAMNWEKHCAHDWHDDDHFWSWFSINRNETLADHNVPYNVYCIVHLDMEAYPNLEDDMEKQQLRRRKKHYKHRILNVCVYVCAGARTVCTHNYKEKESWLNSPFLCLSLSLSSVPFTTNETYL